MINFIRRFVVAFVICSLVGDSVSLAVPKGGMVNFNPTEMTALFGKKVYICTPEGYKWVTWQELASIQEQHETKKHDCKICHSTCHSSGFIHPNEIAYLIQNYTDFENVGDEGGNHYPSFSYYHSPPRSPPYFS